MPEQKDIDFKWLFSKKEEEGKRLFSLPSFTAPDTDVLQSFSSLDPRIKECLAISFDVQVKFLKQIYWSFLEEVADYKQAHSYTTTVIHAYFEVHFKNYEVTRENIFLNERRCRDVTL